ncbi:phosphotransferase [Nonomuraea sp. PA05]|uniref:phosphotransferase family protein n=1 Tax=Nonomuraea sp. PA05 TaxID=2604466 RepID=UPI0011D6C9C1|nr:phosphotransferase [Nonomuraea sp. PA05]TYB66713.1 phosphotransferase [Nonomuraea sp. PA05]
MVRRGRAREQPSPPAASAGARGSPARQHGSRASHLPRRADPRQLRRRHWAYWRREPLAYTSGLLPRGPHLTTPRCLQRLRATTWTPVDADPRIERLWRRKDALLARLAGLPTVLSHGDFSAGNILATPAGATVLLDWATLSAGPVGADLAALALSTFTDPLDAYLAGTDRFARADVELGYRATLALTGAGRVHWMLSSGTRVPDGYEEFILSRLP